ncbi:MAG TPA: pilus assembly protein N-terminal domain-containing protein [Bryobacteraceae bacterium]|nr:pilus assembly protein N-terminal domain-containing protein [Bryobacteraceae bacterium]
MKRAIGTIFGASALAVFCMGVPGFAQSGTQELKLTVGKSVVIDYPSDVGRISTSNPDVVDAVPITSREILINAKANGQSTLVVWSKSGERSFFAVTVDQNLEPITKLLKETFPNENIDVRASRDSASLNGRVSSAVVAERAVALVTPLLKSVVNNLQVAPGPIDKQIVLHVKFAELDRVRSEQLGLNIFSTGATNTIGSVSTGQFFGGQVSPSGALSLADALNIFAFRPDLNLAATLRALQSNNVLQILAEPNLVTTNGKEASFLAGGEFPVPVIQGGGNAGAVTVQFREFGIRLKFLPIVTANGTIKMHVQQELSTIDLNNAVVLSGFTIPALSTRRTETDVELGEGQSFAIAGMIDDRVTQTLSRIPGLANIPILGTLFKSRDLRKNKSELVVLVTPETIAPYNPADPKPMPHLEQKGLPDSGPGMRGLTKAGPTPTAALKP